MRELYLAAQPTAAYYVDFGDFVFLRLGVESIRYVGGYGRMSWVEAADYAVAEPDPLAGDGAERIIGHMNDDHADAQVLVCQHLAGFPETTSASMSGVDRYGFDMIAIGPSGRTAVRVAFDEPCDDVDSAAEAIIAMVRQARASADA